MSQGGSSAETGHYEAVSDDAGRFSIEGIVPGRYTLVVERMGYVSQSYGQGASRGSAAILTLAPGENVNNLLFRLVPWSVISGRITNEDGEPLPDVHVVAMRSRSRNGKRSLLEMAQAETNDLGEYRLWELEKGHYVVRAEFHGRWFNRTPKMNLPGADAATPAGYAHVFYPGTSDVARAATIDLSDGQEMPGIDFAFLPSRAVRIRGHVFDATLGRPASGCCVQLIRLDPQAPDYSYSGSDIEPPKGSFELQAVVPGSYEVLAVLRSEGRVRSARRRVEVGDTDVEGVDFAVARGADVRGRVLVEKAVNLDMSRLRVSLVAEGQSSFSRPVEVSSDGTFIVSQVADGDYHVRVYGFAGAFLKAVHAGGQDVLQGGFSVESGAFKSLLEIVLSGAGGVINGAVGDEDGLPFPGATVVLIPKEPLLRRDTLEKEGNTDQYGRFILYDVRPGAYNIFAWRDVEYGDWNDPDFMKPLENKAFSVEVEENGRATVQLTLLQSSPGTSSPH